MNAVESIVEHSVVRATGKISLGLNIRRGDVRTNGCFVRAAGVTRGVCSATCLADVCPQATGIGRTLISKPVITLVGRPVRKRGRKQANMILAHGQYSHR